MKCVIMQPTYLPWAGYFNLISQADFFVFFDDVQYEKRSWQSRNRILISGKPHWISVPVIHTNQIQKICDTLIDDSQKWREKQQRTLRQNYAKHRYVSELSGLIEIIGDESIKGLSELNIGIIKHVCSLLHLECDFVLSSELGLPGKRSDKLIAICEHLKCDEYISPQGSAEYLAEDRFSEKTKVRLQFQEFLPAPYQQPGTDAFVSHMSIFDVIANIGVEAASAYVRHQ